MSEKGDGVQEPDPNPRPIDHILLAGAAAGGGSGPALVLGDRELGPDGLERLVGQLALWLAEQGVRPGDRVASWLPKGLWTCLLPLAAPRAGAIHVPVNPLLKRAQLAHILADSGAVLLLTGAGRADSLEPGDVPPGCRLVLEGAVTLPEQALAQSTAGPQTLAAILYTSGSTGRPKGVMLSHANLWLGAVSVAHYLRLAGDDRTLAVLPLAFDYGQNQLLSTWLAGGTVIPLDYLTPRDVLRAVARHRITTLAGVPPLWVQLVEGDWTDTATLRRLTNSGGALTEPLVRRLRALAPQADLYAMYGLTEAFRSTYLDPALIDAHPTAIGGPIPFADLHVLRADGDPAAPGEPGELVHAGPLVAAGYWRDPERTAQRFRPLAGGTGLAVWSGDTVVRGADGLLRFVGRADEMIKSAGNRISPTEIEEAAVASGATNEAVALGIADDRLGQAVLLIAAGDGSTEAALRAHLKRDLPGFMQPQRIVWRAALPRTPNGKLDRAGLKAELAP
jgi:acyl-CoA ligase (AMP-forming) (exosortase A-associated)